MQEIITYIILSLTVGYVLYRVAKLFVVNETKLQCDSYNCSGCKVNGKCLEEVKIVARQ